MIGEKKRECAPTRRSSTTDRSPITPPQRRRTPRVMREKYSSLSSEFNPILGLLPRTRFLVLTALFYLSLTTEVCDEALELPGCSLVVSYHPPVRRPCFPVDLVVG
jgi:hypothetical protein